MRFRRPRALLDELKRRKVFRVATVYAAVGFVVVQASDIVFPHLQLPEWTVTLVVVLAILGFPIALVLAWAFELTPDGVVRTGEGSAREESALEGSAPEGSKEAAGGTPAAAGGDGAAASPRPPMGAAIGAGVVLVAVVAGTFLLLGRDPLPEQDARPVGQEPDRSIAVLPLLDLSPGRDHEWFSDGITEDILLHLSHVPDLKVIGRTSVMRYKGRDLGARQIGLELDVATILEGSVRRADERVRIGVQLIRTATEEQLWAESWDRDVTDIFAIQSEIARQIAATLQARLSPAQTSRLARAPTDALDAYDLHLRGREHARRLTRSDLERAMELFRRAIELDPDFAQAHAGLAYAFAAMDGYHGLGRHWLDSAWVAAREAVSRDPEEAEAQEVLALVQWNSGRLAEAIETYGRTLELRPSSGEAYWGLAFTRWLQGDVVEANRLARRAVELDPGDPGFHTLLGRTHAAVGDGAEAERRFRHAIALQSDFPWAHQDLLWVLIGTGEHDRAAAHLRSIAGEPLLAREYRQNSFLLALHRSAYAEAADWHRRDPEGVVGGIVSGADVAFALSAAGDAEGPRALWLPAIEGARAAVAAGADGDAWMRVGLGRTLAAAGEAEEALGHLEAAADLGWLAYPLVDLARDPLLASLAGNARFERLRARLLEKAERMRAELRASEARGKR